MTTLLEAMAANMQKYAAANPWTPGVPIRRYRSKLRGITIEFYLNQDAWTLAVVSETDKPSEAAYHEICDVFKMPEVYKQHPILHDGICGTRFTWTAYVQKKLAHTIREIKFPARQEVE